MCKQYKIQLMLTYADIVGNANKLTHVIPAHAGI